MITAKSFLFVVLAMQCQAVTAQRKLSLSLAELHPRLTEVVGRKTTVESGKDARYLKISEDKGEGLVWLPVKKFANGTITITMRGKDALQRSFIGIAFHGVNDSTYDAVYCRPFNFRAADSVRRIHMIQYIAHPAFTWKKLREERNAVFEKAIVPPPNPDDWFTMKLVVKDNVVQGFINHQKTPALTVEKLSGHKTGKIGLFVGDGSGGDFKHISITYKKS